MYKFDFTPNFLKIVKLYFVGQNIFIFFTDEAETDFHVNVHIGLCIVCD